MPSTPFSRPFSQIADSGGSALIPITPPSSVAYFSGYVVATSGFLTGYQLQDASGNALAGAIGVTAVVGPLRLNPGDKAQLQVTGAPALAQINCMLLGDTAADSNELGRMVAPTQGGQQVSTNVPLAVAQVDRQVLAAPSTSVTIPAAGVFAGTSAHLQIRIRARSTTAALTDRLQCVINGDFGANYDQEGLQIVGGPPGPGTLLIEGTSAGFSGVQLFLVTGATAEANKWGFGVLDVPDLNVLIKRAVLWHAGEESRFNFPDMIYLAGAGFYNVVSVVSTIQFSLLSGASFVAGSTFSTYGFP